MTSDSIWRRIKSVFIPAKPAPLTFTHEEAMGWVRDRVRRDVASGYYASDEIIRNAVYDVGDEMPAEEAEREARRLLPVALAEHSAEQANWPERTDYDRLDAAFAALEADGIIARQNFSCCGSCGSTEIWDEMEAVRDAGGPASGYAFFHVQDTDGAVDGDDLYLNYGSSTAGEDAALAVAREIVEHLEAQGLQTTWTGSWNQRIGVQLDWKRRRPAADGADASATFH